MKAKLYWENIVGYFEEDEWPLCNIDEEDWTVNTYIRGDNATFRIFIWLDEESKVLNVSWYFQNTVPSNKNHVVLDLVNRLNHRYMQGKFVMNPESGILALRISYRIDGTRFSTELFHSLMNMGVWRADGHYPEFMQLIYGDYTGDEVLEEKKKPQLRLVEKTEEQVELFEEDEACT